MRNEKGISGTLAKETMEDQPVSQVKGKVWVPSKWDLPDTNVPSIGEIMPKVLVTTSLIFPRVGGSHQEGTSQR